MKYNKIIELAKENKNDYKAFLSGLKRKPPKNLDTLMQDAHNKVFDEIDCLSCANCCALLGPRLTDRDIERLGKALRLRPSEVVNKYLRIDEDKDFVFKEMPCPFLATDNYCLVYENRPKACREYPHTNQKRIKNVLKLTLKNIETCPAIPLILNNLKVNLK